MGALQCAPWARILTALVLTTAATARGDGLAAAGSDPAIAAYLAAWNGAAGELQQALAPGFVDRTMLLPLDANGFAAQLDAWRSALPDLRVTLLERLETPGRMVLRLRYEGRPATPETLVPLSGGRVMIEQTEWLALQEGRISARQAAPDDWTVPVEWLFVPPPAEPLLALPAETLAEFGPGRFLESIVLAPDGRLFVSTGLEGGIVTIDGSGRVQPFAQLDVGSGGLMMCLAFDERGALFATVVSPRSDVHGVWRFEPDGSASRLAAMPPGSVPNGLALDGRGGVLVAESFGGAIWRIPLAGGPAVPWLRHAWLAPRPLVGRFPGANGLQRRGKEILVASSDRSLLLSIAIASDGTAGEPSILASGLPGDDFAVAPDGSLYVTTHPFNTVVRVTRAGERIVVAGPGQGVIGPTAAAFGADGALYITTDGGLFRPLPGVTPRASVVRLNVSAR